MPAIFFLESQGMDLCLGVVKENAHKRSYPYCRCSGGVAAAENLKSFIYQRRGLGRIRVERSYGPPSRGFSAGKKDLICPSVQQQVGCFS